MNLTRPSTTAGTRKMIAFVLRRDRVWLPSWVLGNAVITVVSALAVNATYSTPQSRAAYQATIDNSASAVLMTGRQVALDTLGGVIVNETSLSATLIVALMAIFTVNRHTRSDEEAGRTELLRSTAVGRHAPLLAALIVTAGASLVTGVLTALAVIACGTGVIGSVAFGLGVGLLGTFFAAVATVAAQGAASARGTLTLGALALGAAFLLRGIGAVAQNWLVWASPLGWAQEVRAFGDERWWPLVPLVVSTVLALWLAAVLGSHRDVGSGLLRERRGAPRASRLLTTSIGLNVRQQRGLIIGWGVGLVAVGLAYGSMALEIPRMLESTPELASILGLVGAGSFIDAYLDYVTVLLATLLCAFVVTSVFKLRTEETKGTAEIVLSTSLSRRRWVVSEVGVAFAAGALLLVATGASVGLGYAVVDHNMGHVGPAVADALRQLPSVLVVGAVAFAVWAWTGRLLAWWYFGFVVIVALLGDLLKLPTWLRSVSPFWHTTIRPGETVAASALVILVAVAATIVAVGVVGIERRDLRTG